MPLIIKPRTLGLLHKVERRHGSGRFIISVLACFDLADPSRLESEQALWAIAGKALPPGTPLDAVMPKPRAELLIAGRLEAPGRGAMMLEARLGGLYKRMAVFGDRWWTGEDGGRYVPTPPRPIRDLLLSPARAFGGPGHAANAAGMGFRAMDRLGTGEPVALPNIENADALITSILDEPSPATFGPVDLLDPSRQALAGTYDAAWLQNVAPGLPDDIHPDFFMTGPQEQWFSTYLAGDEAYALHNFSVDAPLIEQRLPAVAPRAFVGQGADTWSEVPLRLDTLWLIAGARRGILVWHGVLPVADIEGQDVSDVMIAYERMGEPSRPLDHYAAVRRLRCDRETAPRFSFSEWQLTPPKRAGEIEKRDAARLSRAREQSAHAARRMEFVRTRMFDQAALPAALRPAPFPEPEPMLLPTPEEIAAGDVDLGDVLDLLEQQRRDAEQQMNDFTAKAMPALDAMQALRRPDADTADVDAVMASLHALSGEDVGGQLDAAFAQSTAPSAPLDLGEGAQEIAAGLAQAARASDWRGRFLDAMKAEGEDEEMLAQALARALRLPESRPLAAARSHLEEAARFELKLPELAAELPADLPAQTPAEPSVESALRTLEGHAEMPEERVAAFKQQLQNAGETLASQFPRLAPAEGVHPLDALLAELQPVSAQPDAPADVHAAQAAGIAQAIQVVDEAEARLEESLPKLRRLSVTASAPAMSLTPRVSRRFGDTVLEHVRAGMSLAGADLAGIDLAGADLSGLDLKGAFLEGANLANARLRGAQMAGAVLTQARLEHADFSDADLTGANLNRVNGRGMTLDGARLANTLMLEACFAGARARHATFADMRFLAVDFSGADMTGARILRSVLMRCRLDDVRLERGTLLECKVLDCDFSRARLDGATLCGSAFMKLMAPDVSATGADLRGAAFIGESKLGGLDFTEGLGTEVSFFGADLTGANFHKSTCERTLFNTAQLSGATFHLATLRSTVFDGADLGDADFACAQLMEAQFHRANLTRATFRHANLFGADLSDATLSAADFTGAHVVSTSLALETAHG